MPFFASHTSHSRRTNRYYVKEIIKVYKEALDEKKRVNDTITPNTTRNHIICYIVFVYVVFHKKNSELN